MDELVLRAMAKWPNVPALYGWLGLSRRGEWLLREEPVEHTALQAFISRNYAADDQGRWFFQNGPQRVYASLAYTPWILHLQEDGLLQTHTGQVIKDPTVALIDEEGSLLLVFEQGVGLLHDNDLAWAIDRLRHPAGQKLTDGQLDSALAQLQAGQPAELALLYQDRLLGCQPIHSRAVAQRYHFIPNPAQESAS